MSNGRARPAVPMLCEASTSPPTCSHGKVKIVRGGCWHTKSHNTTLLPARFARRASKLVTARTKISHITNNSTQSIHRNYVQHSRFSTRKPAKSSHILALRGNFMAKSLLRPQSFFSNTPHVLKPQWRTALQIVLMLKEGKAQHSTVFGVCCRPGPLTCTCGSMYLIQTQE